VLEGLATIADMVPTIVVAAPATVEKHIVTTKDIEKT
jgi:hypothetical protein